MATAGIPVFVRQNGSLFLAGRTSTAFKYVGDVRLAIAARPEFQGLSLYFTRPNSTVKLGENELLSKLLTQGDPEPEVTLELGPAAGGAGGAAGAEDLQAAFIQQLAQHEVDFVPLPAQLQALMQHANFSHLREKLRLNTTNKADIERAVIRLRLMVSSATVSRLGAACSIVLDGDIPGAYGQHGTLVQYGFRGSEVMCVKIGPREKLLREKLAWTAVSAVCTTPTVLPVLDVVELMRSGAESLPLGVVLMPLCSMSVGFARGAFTGAPHADLAVLVANTATCAGAAAAAFAMANWVHGDIKPSNLLLVPGVPASCRVMLADFGAAASLGSATLELSANFGLDMPPGTTSYDIACLASTIAMLLDPLLRLNTFVGTTLRDRAMHHASREGMLAPLWRLVGDLTQLAADSDLSPEDATVRLHSLLSGAVTGVRSALPASSPATLLSVDDVWPRRVH